MNLTTILLLIGCMQVSASAFSQQITASFKKTSLEKVLNEIGKQSDYNFIYDASFVSKAKPVTAELSDVSIDEALKLIFKDQSLKYEIKEGAIYVMPVSISTPITSLPTENTLQQSYTGTLVDRSDKPIAGATIKVRASAIEAIADARGRFSISAPSGSILEITSVGYSKKEVKLGATMNLGTIQLETSSSDLDEVNVVAYGTSTRREATGSVSVIKGKDLEGIPASNLANLLQGRVAGMDVTNISGSPGSGGIAITIRGYNSLDVEQGRRFSNPLWVVDGVPLNSFTSPVTGTNMLSDINPDMIESIQILKDASAASLYGSRAANGVIVVTTKKGSKNQKAEFSVNASQTFSILPRLPTITTGKAERDLRLKAFKNYQVAYLDMDDLRYKYPTSLEESYLNPNSYLDYFFTGLPAEDNGFYFQDSLNTFYNNSTNFFPMYFETGKVTNANIQTYGGVENVTYGIGLGFYDEKGILKGSGFNRIDLNSNLNIKPVQKLNVDLRFNATLTNRKRGEKSDNYLGGGSPIIETVPGDPFQLSSLYPGEGSSVWNDILEKLGGTQEKNRSVRLRSNFKLGYDITPSLNISSSLAADYALDRRNSFLPSYLSESSYSKSQGESGINLMVLNENLLSYKKIFNEDHSVSAIAGFSYQYDQVEYNGGFAMNSPSDKIYYARPGFPTIGERTWDYGDGFPYTETIAFQNYLSDMQEKALLSYFSRVEYGYKQKYLVSASFRRDGSSVFGANNKWGTFPSIAAGWSFSEENFIKENLSWLNFGKLRASWGKSGMHFDQNYLALGIMQAGYWPYQGGSVLVPETGSGLYNENLTWEETDQYDFGLDLDLFNHRLSLTADYYYRYTDNMLMPIRLPGLYNGYLAQWRNAAAVSNEGVELMVNYEVIKNSDVYWKISVNGARNWNRFEKSYNGKDVTSEQALTGSQWTIGMPLNGIYALKTNGYINNQNELPIFYNAAGMSNYFARDETQYYKPGDYAFVDLNSDGSLSYNSDDYAYIGSALPRISGGIGTELKWKNFDLNLLMTFQTGRNMINATLLNAQRTDANSWLTHPLLIDINSVSYWERPGDNADYGPIQYDFNVGNYESYIDRQVETVNWLKLKTMALGYNLPSQMTRSLGLQQVRIFLTGENLFTWTNYSGLDPEIVDISTGFDEGVNYPLARKFTLGLTFKF